MKTVKIEPTPGRMVVVHFRMVKCLKCGAYVGEQGEESSQAFVEKLKAAGWVKVEINGAHWWFCEKCAATPPTPALPEGRENLKPIQGGE